MLTYIKEKRNLIIYLIFLITTFILLFQRPPYWDEAHAWMMAKVLSVPELFEVAKHEGHLFMWYIVQMPFAKHDLFYPNAIYILNWSFCMIGMAFFWKKAPFSTLEKTLISFSWPFFWNFAHVARCYAMGVMFLFIILTFWKDRLKHPYLISTLLILAANTSAMLIIGAFPLGLIFLYDLFKEANKRKIAISLSICALGAILVLLQVGNAYDPYFKPEFMMFSLRVLKYFTIFDNETDLISVINKFTAIFTAFLYMLSSFTILKSRRSFFFMISTAIMICLLFTYKYPGDWWHYVFFYVFFIGSVWMARDEKVDFGKFKKAFSICFIGLLVTLCLKSITFKKDYFYDAFESQSVNIYNELKENNLIHDNDKIFLLDSYSHMTGAMPFIKGHKFYNQQGIEKWGKDGYEWFFERDIDGVAKALDPNKRNIMLSSESKNTQYISNGPVIFKEVYNSNWKDYSIYIWEMSKNPYWKDNSQNEN